MISWLQSLHLLHFSHSRIVAILLLKLKIGRGTFNLFFKSEYTVYYIPDVELQQVLAPLARLLLNEVRRLFL